jgi:hypothetical protein
VTEADYPESLPQEVREWLGSLPAESRRFFVETFSQMGHPAFQTLRRLLITPLPPDLEAVFQEAHNGYINRKRGSPFEELRLAKGENAARTAFDYFATDVQAGMRSCYYHFHQFRALESEARRLVTEGTREGQPGHGSIGMPSHSFVAEYMAFTLASRATLDWLSRLLSRYFEEQAGNLYNLHSALRNNRARNQRAQAVADAIDRHRNYLDSQISTNKSKQQTERDRLAHYGYIPWVTLNIVYSEGDVRILLASSHSTESAGSLLQQRLDSLRLAVIDILRSFIT